MKKFLDIVAIGSDNRELADALEHAADMLRRGVNSESVTMANDYSGYHVTFDVRDATIEPWKEKADTYLGK